MRCRRRIPVLLLTFALLAPAPLTLACAAPVTVTTPQGRAAYTADQVVVRVNELMHAAIRANAGGGLPEPTTRTIVEWAVATDKVLATAPAGWQALVAASWDTAKRKIGTPANPAIVAAMSAVDVVLGVVQ